MYITGSKLDLESRLHEFTQNSGDLANYVLESQSYTLDIFLKEKLNREYKHQMLSLYAIVNTGINF